MYDDVFEAFRRIKGKSGVNANAPRRGLAASPAALHVSVCEFARFDANDALPVLDEQRSCGGYDSLPFGGVFLRCAFGLRRGRVSELFERGVDPGSLLSNEAANEGIGRAIRRRYLDAAPIMRSDPQAQVFDALAGHLDFKAIDNHNVDVGFAGHATCVYGATEPAS